MDASDESTIASDAITAIFKAVSAIVVGVVSLRGLNYGSDAWQLLSLLGAFTAVCLALGAFGALIGCVAAASTQALRAGLAGAQPLMQYYLTQKVMAWSVAGLCVISGTLLLGFLPSDWRLPAQGLFVAAAIILMQLPDTIAEIKAAGWYRRIFASGTAPNNQFAQARHLRQQARPFKATFRAGGGYCAEELFIGTSTREASIAPLDIWNNDPVSELVIGASGSGKFASDLSIRCVTYMGSAVYVSVKPELADFAGGRNCCLSESFLKEVRQRGLDPGINPAGITKVSTGKPRFRAMVVDPYRTSVYGEQDCSYTFFGDIPDDLDIAIPRVQALCHALVEEKVGTSTDPFFEECPRSLVFAAIGHVKTRFPPELQALPVVADFLLGRNPRTGAADPAQFKRNLESMLANPAWGGLIALGANTLAKLGDRTFGSVNAEVATKLAWCMEPSMRRHLSGRNRFSYEEVGGDEDFPLSVFIIPGRVAPRASAAFMRCHAAMSTAVFKTRLQRPRLPVLLALDEAKQFLKGCGMAEASLVLRDNRVKQCQYYQDEASARATLGDDGFAEYQSASTKRFYGITTLATAHLVSQILGERQVGDRAFPLADPQTVMRELSVRSNLTYVLPYAGPPVMRLHRRGFKTIDTREGLHLRGLPLQGLYDDGLSRFKN